MSLLHSLASKLWPLSLVTALSLPAVSAAGGVDGSATESARRVVTVAPLKLNVKVRRPTSAERLFRRAVAAADAGRHDRARALLRELGHRYPDFAPAHVLAGALSQVEGDLQVARSEYLAYLASAPNGEHADELRKVLAAMERQDPALASTR
ncbi:MAG: hypothetical protein IRZ16_14845 [Myxococcaceae bacterium]|nr:hypothetical protein [Myxococcaceae bacterium]